MTVEYLDLADFIAIAVGVTGWDLDVVLTVTNLDRTWIAGRAGLV